jgi:hypothetical protein
MLVPVIYPLLLLVIYLFVLVYLLLSLVYFVHCLTIYSFVVFILINSLFIVQEEKNNSDPELCSGISIQLTVHHHQYESINIIQQTPKTLS